MNYDIYLFDADNTLFDFDRAEENALIQMFTMYNFNYTNQIRDKYRKISAVLWSLFEKQEISKIELQTQRFAKLFQEIEIDCDAKIFNEKYLIELGKGVFLIDGAYETCKVLNTKDKKIYIVTNGISITQKMRIKDSDIKDFITDLFVSEDVGFQKPQKQYFDYVFKKIGEIDKKKVIIIGDSLTADVQGGINAGIDTCWFNPMKKDNLIGITPNYEISKLSRLYKHAEI